MASLVYETAIALLKRESEDADAEDSPHKSTQQEQSSAFAIFILITLLIIALFTSYFLQTKKIQAVHETVLSIFAGMVAGLVVLLFTDSPIRQAITFDYQFFFNLILPPIILASGYELHQANFFRNIGSILTFAFAGTFISAIVLGLIVWLWTRLPLDGFQVTFVEAIALGATLSATDPVTILAIFNAYKVDPKLYTVIFGESILNDAVAIVLFETAMKFNEVTPAGGTQSTITPLSIFPAIGVFLLVFFGSLFLGMLIGIFATLLLKFTHVRRFPKIESCLVILIAYGSYYFSNGIYLSGIVTLLFCGITMKHYAYYNMSRRTQLTTKFFFQITAQLTENFVFIWLGIYIFADRNLKFRPPFILITVVGICVSRYVAVFPLSRLINWVIRVRAQRRGQTVGGDELPHNYQVMLFWAGLRGAVGVALAAGFVGDRKDELKATVLVVVVLTVIIFGGTTARMLEIMEIRTGVVEEADSDDEFDIETVANGTYYRKGGTGVGNIPKRNSGIGLERLNGSGRNGRPRGGSRANGAADDWDRDQGYSSSNHDDMQTGGLRRANSSGSRNGLIRDSDLGTGRTHLQPPLSASRIDDDLLSDGDLPPLAPRRAGTQTNTASDVFNLQHNYGEGASGQAQGSGMTATGAIRDFFRSTDDSAAWFKRLDEAVIKPTLLLDQGKSGHGPDSNV